ncbi:MAG: c-type cytochrome [Aureispira sp.]
MYKIVVLLALLTIFLIACDPSTSTPPTPPTTSTPSTVATEEGKENKENGPSGALLYRERCVTCHGANGRMGNNGAKLLPESPLNVAQRIEVVTYGRNIMPAFEDMMTPEEIEAVVQFTMKL